MTAFFEMTVPGAPVPKLRHRDGRNGQKYTPQKTVDYEKIIRDMARIYHKGEPTARPCSLFVTFLMPIPTSYSKKKREELLSTSWHHTKKPDVTNLVKSIEDGLNGVVWVDDSQVSTVIARKLYAAEPAVHITVSEFLPPE